MHQSPIPHTPWTEQLRLHEQARALAPALRREAIAAFSPAALWADGARAARRLAYRLERRLARHQLGRTQTEA